MNKDLSITKTIEINADNLKVWDALTNPEKISQYLFGTTTKTDWKPGSPITFEGEWEGKAYQDKGTITDVREGQFLQYTYWSSMSGIEDKPENYITITFKVGSNGYHSTLSLTQEGAKDQAALQHSEENWTMVLQKLKEVVEAG